MGWSQSQGPTRGSSRAFGQSAPQAHVWGRPQAVDAILRSSKVSDSFLAFALDSNLFFIFSLIFFFKLSKRFVQCWLPDLIVFLLRAIVFWHAQVSFANLPVIRVFFGKKRKMVRIWICYADHLPKLGNLPPNVLNHRCVSYKNVYVRQVF